MLLKLKNLIRINQDDLKLFAGVLGVVFLLVHVVTAFAVKFSGEGRSLLLSGAILPFVAALLVLIATAGHVYTTYLHGVRMGQTRKGSMALMGGIALFEGVFAMILSAALNALERAFAPSFWMWLAGAERVVIGRESMVVYPQGYVRGDTSLLAIEDFSLAWHWWLLLLLGGMALGLIIGAVLDRFGSKGATFLWLFYFGAIIGQNLLPWKTHEVTNILFPALIIATAAGLIWSVLSLLRTTIRS